MVCFNLKFTYNFALLINMMLLMKKGILGCNIIYLFILICIGIALPIKSQNNYKVKLTGTVYEYDHNNKRLPLEFAAVSIPEIALGTTSDENGRYILENVPTGKIRMQIQYLGKVSIDTLINVNKDLVLNFTMRNEDFKLKEVTVTATNSRSGKSTSSHISRSAMDHMQATSLYDVMSLMPGGISQNQDMSSAQQINIRQVSSSSGPEAVVLKVENDLKEELKESDKHIFVRLEKVDSLNEVISVKESQDIISMMYLMPNGFMHKSLKMDLTNISLNMGVVEMNEKFNIYFSIRSPMESAKDELSNKLSLIASMFKAKYVLDNNYPGWNYDEGSKLRKQYVDFVKETEGITLKEEGTHSGLETGIFKGALQDLDIITLGPDMFDIHTPDERLNMNSFYKCYQRLIHFLERL